MDKNEARKRKGAATKKKKKRRRRLSLALSSRSVDQKQTNASRKKDLTRSLPLLSSAHELSVAHLQMGPEA